MLAQHTALLPVTSPQTDRIACTVLRARPDVDLRVFLKEDTLSAQPGASFSSVEVHHAGSVLAVTLVGAARGPDLSLAIVAEDGSQLRIPFTAERADLTAADLTAMVDLDTLAVESGSRWDLHVVDGVVKVRWDTVPWDVDNLRAAESASGTVLVTAPTTGSTAFAVVANPAVPEPPKVATRRLISRKGGLEIRARVKVAPHAVSAFVIHAVERSTGEVHAFPARAKREKTKAGPWRDYRVTGRIDWRRLPPDVRDESFDVSIAVESPEFSVQSARVPAAVGVGAALSRVRTGRVDRGATSTMYDPRLTFKSRLLTVSATTLPSDALQEFGRLRRGLAVRRWWYRRRNAPLWLIGEMPFKAQDTGAAFFAFMRREHPEVDARFVVAAESPDLPAVAALGPTVIHGSREHVASALMADRVIGSHHADYVLPARVPAMRRKVRAPLVFLQHGVMGTKWMADLYGRGTSGFTTDLFVVSSPRERDLIKRDFHYRHQQIAVTGLSRFDTLLAPSEPLPQIVVIPTWRDWVMSADDFQASEFRTAWQSLLTDPRFTRATAGNSVLVILHPNFRRFASDFEVPGVEVLQQGDVPVQHLLRSSRVLITDYSSVGFDFALLHRPVLYFQFDRGRFLGERGSHLDLDADLPGAIGLNADAVLDALEALAARGFTQDPLHTELADTYFPMRDTNSCARIYTAVAKAKRTRPHAAIRRVEGAARGLVGMLRRQKRYAPVQRALYRTARLLPLRPDTVLFECNLGRGYGDSPRAIYRELAEHHPQMRVVWASHVPIPDASPGTRVVPRMSVQYFLLLARAKYLVNNQSFPAFIRRRSGQVYVQTWHGTPLKRMLHDLDQITGRDPGYAARATDAAAQWSVLTSPNAHTTAALASALRHRAEVLELGYPRNDIFYGPRAEHVAQHTRRRLGVDDDRLLILFAPTFRDRGLDSALLAGPTQAIDFEHFAREFGDRATLVLRRHVLDRNPAIIPRGLEHCVVDATGGPDVQDLLVATDVLVTDYSSVFFDFLNTRRPCVFYAPDLEDYRDNLRGFYLDYSTDLPGPVTTNMDELTGALRAAIEDGGFPGYDLDAFARRYCPMDDGAASARVVDAVFGAGVT